jgi:hypothetical protein
VTPPRSVAANPTTHLQLSTMAVGCNQSRSEIINSKNMRWIDQLARPRSEPHGVTVGRGSHRKGQCHVNDHNSEYSRRGAGQAGLAVSHFLSELSQDHVVLERANRPGDAWRNHRWDSFTLNTPRWQSRLPGVQYGEDDPDGCMPREEVVTHFEDFATARISGASGSTTKPVSTMLRSKMASRSGPRMSSWRLDSIRGRRSPL